MSDESILKNRFCPTCKLQMWLEMISLDKGVWKCECGNQIGYIKDMSNNRFGINKDLSYSGLEVMEVLQQHKEELKGLVQALYTYDNTKVLMSKINKNREVLRELKGSLLRTIGQIINMVVWEDLKKTQIKDVLDKEYMKLSGEQSVNANKLGTDVLSDKQYKAESAKLVATNTDSKPEEPNEMDPIKELVEGKSWYIKGIEHKLVAREDLEWIFAWCITMKQKDWMKFDALRERYLT